MLLGCESPIVLRPNGNEQYQVVGECYVDGLMGGEALLGPLPEHTTPIELLDEVHKEYNYAFLDKRTGKTQYGDPRLGLAPTSEGMSE